jgi:hypothetical protein
VDLTEHDRRLVALEQVKQSFNTYLLDLNLAQKEEYWGQMQVVYIPYFAFEEIPALFGSPPKEDISMVTSTRRMVHYLRGGASENELPAMTEARRREYLERFLRKLNDPLVLARGIVENHRPKILVVKRLLLRFVVPGSGTVPDSVRPVSLEEVGSEELPVLSDFRDVGIILEDKSTTPAVLRLVREDLIRTWDTLATWISEERDFLNWRKQTESACEAWQRNRDLSRLLHDQRLQEAMRWREQKAADLSPAILAFLEESERADPVAVAERLVESFGDMVCQRFFLRFVTSAQSRRFVGNDEIDSAEEQRLLSAALKAGIVHEIPGGTLEKETRTPEYQLASEDFVRRWHKLREWTEQDATFLRRRDEAGSMAKLWANDGKTPRLLSRGPVLAYQLATLKPREGELEQTLREFLRASEQQDLPRSAEAVLSGLDPDLRPAAETLMLRFLIIVIEHQGIAADGLVEVGLEIPVGIPHPDAFMVGCSYDERIAEHIAAVVNAHAPGEGIGRHGVE